jgi:hypothetical protein
MLAFAALLLVVFATYQGTLRQFFIADDFTHLRFLRDDRTPFWRYLDPSSTYSDPVTLARYQPVKLFIMLALERAFGMDAAPYHAVSIVVHAMNALLVGYLGRAVFGARSVGALGALLFATSRLAAQNVCWMGCIANLVGTTFLLASVALYLRPRGGIGGAAIGAGLLFASFLCRSDAAVSVAFLAPLWVRDAVIERRRAARWYAGLAVLFTGAFLALSYVSQRCFPEPRMRFGVLPGRFAAFLADLFVPWEIPPALKAIVVFGLLLAAGTLRDRRVFYALYGIGLGAGFWTVVVYLNLTPRYFYAYAALSSLVVAVLIHRGAARLLGPRGPVAAIAFGAIVAAWSAWIVAREDVVWFDYLSTPGRKLVALYERQKAAGASLPLRVSMKPYKLLTNSDERSFEPYLTVVYDGTETVTVDTEADRFVRYYGKDFGRAFWFIPWFIP